MSNTKGMQLETYSTNLICSLSLIYSSQACPKVLWFTYIKVFTVFVTSYTKIHTQKKYLIYVEMELKKHNQRFIIFIFTLFCLNLVTTFSTVQHSLVSD